MRVPIDGSARVALVASESEAERVPPEFEPVRAPEGRVSLRDLVEEEVLLTLPIVALHESMENCEPQAAEVAKEAEHAHEDSVQRPFANLGELLKR
jgi:uncharacterized protein